MTRRAESIDPATPTPTAEITRPRSRAFFVNFRRDIVKVAVNSSSVFRVLNLSQLIGLNAESKSSRRVLVPPTSMPIEQTLDIIQSSAKTGRSDFSLETASSRQCEPKSGKEQEHHRSQQRSERVSDDQPADQIEIKTDAQT